MNRNQLIQYSANRYYQYHGALERLVPELEALGRRPLILMDARVSELFGDRLQSILGRGGLEPPLGLVFEQECSQNACAQVAARGIAESADSVVGVGGGKVCDAAKIIADKMGVRCILVPTSPATCAATAWLAVEYSDSGAFVGNYWSKLSAYATIVDLDIVYGNCPRRLLAAGMVDAMAKQPEISYNRKYSPLWHDNQFSRSASSLAKQIYDDLLMHGLSVYRAFGEQAADQRADDVIAACISLTGLVSALACGGRQAAVSHSIYSYVCNTAPQIRNNYLHGEIVGASLIYQMALNGDSDKELNAFAAFLSALHMPKTLSDLGLHLDALQRKELYGFLIESLSLEAATTLPELQRFESLLFASESPH